MYSRLIERKKELGISNSDITAATGVSERTLARIFSRNDKEKRGHSTSTIKTIANFLGLTLDEVYEDTNAFVGGTTYAEMQAKIDALTAENAMLASEVASLKAQTEALSSLVKVLELSNAHKDELLAVHNHYSSMLMGK